MNFFRIKKLQSKNGLSMMQGMIDSGHAFKRLSLYQQAMVHLESGECMLPKIAHRDYAGNLLPARQMQRPDEIGSYDRCIKYWNNYLTKSKQNA
jgi:hypothetical protein